MCYLDDILVAAKDQGTLRKRGKGVKKRLDGIGIRSNEGKSMYEGPTVDWLGYELLVDSTRALKESPRRIYTYKHQQT